MPKSTTTIRVFLLDDHDVVRQGIAELINGQDDLSVVGAHGHVDGAVEAAVASRPDVAVLDVRLGDGSGVEVCRQLRSDHPEIACLMLTSFADDRAMIDASVAGASGYVLKQIQSNDLIESIRKVAGGAQLLDAAEVRLALDRLRNSMEGRVDNLTEQEHRIFELIGEGYSNRQIAEELFLAEKTVKNYVSNLLAKLGMSRRTEAAATAARLDERQRMRER
jgi:DNA-binding NarL/FixJ family response regulator